MLEKDQNEFNNFAVIINDYFSSNARDLTNLSWNLYKIT